MGLIKSILRGFIAGPRGHHEPPSVHVIDGMPMPVSSDTAPKTPPPKPPPPRPSVRHVAPDFETPSDYLEFHNVGEQIWAELLDNFFDLARANGHEWIYVAGVGFYKVPECTR